MSCSADDQNRSATSNQDLTDRLYNVTQNQELRFIDKLFGFLADDTNLIIWITPTVKNNISLLKTGTMGRKLVWCTALVFLMGTLLPGEAAKWSYEGKSGPANWHQLFQPCGGKKQSPIDLKAEETMLDPSLKDFALWYDPPRPGSNLTVHNNGHTLQVDLEGDFFVSNGGLEHVYKAAQFHFHWGHKGHHGSEHLMDGKPSPIEMHLVTYDSEKYDNIGKAVAEPEGLAVLGTMFEISKEDNPAFTSIIKAIKFVRDPHDDKRIRLPLDTISIRDILPHDISRYYRYRGSLTTPLCYESVIWTVFEQMQTISEAQLKEFRSLLQLRRHHKHSKPSASGDDKPKTATLGGGEEGAKGRSRRSLSHQEKHYMREVFVELGIKGNHAEEAYLKDQMMMMSDMPVDDMDRNAQDKTADMMGAKKELEHPPIPERVQIVNNFRPVQPLHGRVVYRSFKLRESPAWDSGRVRYRVDDTPDRQAQDSDGPGDGAGSIWDRTAASYWQGRELRRTIGRGQNCGELLAGERRATGRGENCGELLAGDRTAASYWQGRELKRATGRGENCGELLAGDRTAASYWQGRERERTAASYWQGRELRRATGRGENCDELLAGERTAASYWQRTEDVAHY
ncbi:LOW QUALITY PROTEIN: carbonic anhydrase [Plakobranchus ocellatus]|uniref:carbonic anhydrase n=1 Tax=Plakobranchus ocellatus TaxID=259542 RepID=A0AAV3YLR0_9GAST|nr:LOW QUALITY PROTEIN: carbonic anhydrase [Plakobranchus ocellatus]